MSELSLLQTFDLKFEVTTHLLCHGPVLLVHQPVLPLPLPDAEVADLVVDLVANLEEEKDLVLINSLLSVGRYINMDPSLTYLVISQTQVIRFGQFFLAESVRTNYTFLV